MNPVIDEAFNKSFDAAIAKLRHVNAMHGGKWDRECMQCVNLQADTVAACEAVRMLLDSDVPLYAGLDVEEGDMP